MEKVELPIHEHPLSPITRFSSAPCKGCGFYDCIYGGYRCNELGCQAVFHRECAESLPEITHSSHPHHPLKLFQSDEDVVCSRCGTQFENGYICSICDFKLDLLCAKGTAHILENSDLHQHPLERFGSRGSSKGKSYCKTCRNYVTDGLLCYNCYQCDLVFHEECAKFFPEANHTTHSQHPLKLLISAPDYVDKKCLLCGIEFDQVHHKIYHCDVCNFSICNWCMGNPPPARVESLTTHEHQLQLVPRLIEFTCNACGTLGDRSPYFCLQCNFMIHRECIDLPRIININRHDHRISYTRRLGHGEWKCKVCRKKVDGFYGAYTCGKCPSFAIHSLCATREDVWDMVELEGMPEEEEIAPFEVIDSNTIKHFSHDHNLGINKDGHNKILPDNIACEACLQQILSEPFYSCKQCHFVLHEKCANHPRKKRHVRSNQPFTLLTDSRDRIDKCWICDQNFTGFRYKVGLSMIIDVRCAEISDTLEHESHQHPLYFNSTIDTCCNGCGERYQYVFTCDECDYTLDGTCALYPKEVRRSRYDDHPLFLSFGDMNVDSDYWCEACETKVNPKAWFYTCYDCGTILHVSCVVGDLSYIMPGSVTSSNLEIVVSNTSICRPLCFVCKSRCKLPSIIKTSMAGVDVYVCSFSCNYSIN